MTTIESRSVHSRVEFRTGSSGKTTVAGYAAVFGEEADIGGYFREVIAKGAFANSVRTADVRAYFDHDSGRVLGRRSAGTLRLNEDAKGLAVEIDLPDTTDGRDVKTLIERGDVSGMSFGFMVTKQEWDETGDVPLRTVLEAELYEVSIVSIPAYDGTSIALQRSDHREKEFDHVG